MTASGTVATLGILCEPIAAVEAQTTLLTSAAMAANPSSSQALVPVAAAGARTDPVSVAQGIAKNLFNAVSGFAQSYQTPEGRTAYAVDFSAVEKWYSNFERKIKTGGVQFLFQND
ncbi:hypothetical protein OIV83_000942 [Microbotryomycetes sp. JL201]|nr:hypothetical protein OIV83_000942 [Microbotryomycetes sp. JL201]